MQVHTQATNAHYIYMLQNHHTFKIDFRKNFFFFGIFWKRVKFYNYFILINWYENVELFSAIYWLCFRNSL